jgi:hypothetical protein
MASAKEPYQEIALAAQMLDRIGCRIVQQSCDPVA